MKINIKQNDKINTVDGIIEAVPEVLKNKIFEYINAPNIIIAKPRNIKFLVRRF
jgi:hypothetical protein